MNTLDIVIIIAAVAAVLAIGLLSSRGNESTDDFLLAGKSINKLQAGFSMAATDFGGSGLVAAIGYCYVIGMSGIWWNLAAAPAFLVVGLLLASKINRMDGATLPEYLGNRYSPAVKYLASVMHVMTNLVALSVQLTVACATLYSVTGIPVKYSLAISVILVILLTSGGLKAVVNTDATLFVIIVCSVLLAVPIVLHAGGGLHAITAAVPDGFLSVGQLGFWTPFSWFLLCLLTYSTNQNYIQRMVSAKNEGTARFGACFTAGFYLLISLAIGLIGISTSVLLPEIGDTNMVFPEMLKAFFPHGLIGLGLAGVFAATISTGTSLLHATATLIVNDLYIPLKKGRAAGDRHDVLISRIVVLAVALFSTLISLYSSNIISVVYAAGLFYGVSVFMPMILGMFTDIVTEQAAVVSIVVTVAFSLLWEYVLHTSVPVIGAVPSNVMGLLVSTVLLLAVSAVTRKKAQPDDAEKQ
ncbi:MAG: sodium:solute symporter family protein [Mogibacterium sp.]|nr:sodium:solute symporter family protein [Mogibacterium sp.]